MIADALSVVAAVLLVAGALVLVIAAWGVIRLPDALARQHAATKAGTLAVAVVALGALAAQPASDWAWRIAVIVGFLLVTLPLGSHLLARAALREAGQQDQADTAPIVGSPGDRDAPPAAHSP